MGSPKQSLDPVVKLGLGVLVGSFLLIGIGMFLSRPDRSIPPYSIGFHQNEFVAIHVPSWTSDSEIESLVRRFGKVVKNSKDFSQMKVRPTTPGHPKGRYESITIYIFSDPNQTEPDQVKHYLSESKGDPQKEKWKKEYENDVRGGYSLNEDWHQGWLGPVEMHNDPKMKRKQILFEERISIR